MELEFVEMETLQFNIYKSKGKYVLGERRKKCYTNPKTTFPGILQNN